MNWFILALASAISGSVARILQKVLLKHEQSDVFAFSFVFQMSVAFLFLLGFYNQSVTCYGYNP